MRRRAALYLLLGLTTAVLIVALATGLQTGGSADPNAWMRAQRHVPLLQMLDLAAAFLFVVIGLYGLTVSRLQLQLRHQAEDFGDQMQTLLHRNEELTKVNDEYAEQIAALEADQEARPALSMGEGHQRVLAALHWQVEAQAQQLEAVHRTLEHQHNALQELQQQMHTLEGRAAPALQGSATTPLLEEAERPTSAPEDAKEVAASTGERAGIADWTVNDGSTLIGEMLEFDVSAFSSPEPDEPALSNSPQTVSFADAYTYPVDDSLLAVAAGHLSRMPESAPTPPKPERVEISIRKSSEAQASESFADSSDRPALRTEGALALDLAESALSSLQLETKEALSSLRAQVEATHPKETVPSTAGNESEKPSPTVRRKPWHLRF